MQYLVHNLLPWCPEQRHRFGWGRSKSVSAISAHRMWLELHTGDKLSSQSQNKIRTVQSQNSSGVGTSTPKCSGVSGSTARRCLQDNVSQSIFVLTMYRELQYTLALASWEFRSHPSSFYYKCGILPMWQDGIIKTKVKAQDCGELFLWENTNRVAKVILHRQICSTFTVQKSWWEPWVILLALYTLCDMSSLSHSSLWALNRYAEPNNHRQAASYKCSFWE